MPRTRRLPPLPVSRACCFSQNWGVRKYRTGLPLLLPSSHPLDLETSLAHPLQRFRWSLDSAALLMDPKHPLQDCVLCQPGIFGQAGNQSFGTQRTRNSMIAGKLPKTVLVMLISLLCLAAGPAAALAGAAKSSLSLRGNSSMGRIIPGASLSRSLSSSSNPAPGPLRRISASAVLPRTPATRIKPHRGGRDLLAPRSLRGPLARLPHSSSTPPKGSPSARPPSNRSATNNLPDRVVAQARHYLGTPYRLGGSLENGRATDCSGFVQYIYQKSNIDLPRSSSEQAREGKAVAYTLDLAKLRPGDLLFFAPRGRHINHVGIYAGDGQMIHASNSSGRVVISDLHQPKLEGSFVVAKRLSEV